MDRTSHRALWRHRLWNLRQGVSPDRRIEHSAAAEFQLAHTVRRAQASPGPDLHVQRHPRPDISADTPKRTGIYIHLLVLSITKLRITQLQDYLAGASMQMNRAGFPACNFVMK